MSQPIASLLLEENLVLPYHQDGKNITVVMANPFSHKSVSRIKKFYSGFKVELAYAEKDDMRAFFDNRRAWKEQKQNDNLSSNSPDPLLVGSLEFDDPSMSNNVRTFQLYLRKALDNDASDIHIEPMKNSLRIRFATGGLLSTVTQLPASMAPKIAGAIKAASEMDITKRNAPADGRMTVSYKKKYYDLRVSSYPCLYGENIVIRVLKKEESLGSVDSLGFSPANLRKMRENLTNPSGVTIVTGPTGSGKTTTLYSCLTELSAHGAKHIITIEDPVEYKLDGVTQGSVNVRAGMDYVTSLASIMRQNPDIIMVGEIRDKVAADAVIQSALTGHKVFTTFHTENSTGALSRLLNMGVENFMISETVVFVCSQRLARKVCQECIEPYKPDSAVIKAMTIKDFNVDNYTFYHGSGKVNGSKRHNCGGAGFHGRIPIHEVLSVNDNVSEAILDRKTAREIRDIVKDSAGLLSLKEDAIYKIVKGLTTFEEVFRVIPHVREVARPLETIIKMSEDNPEESLAQEDIKRVFGLRLKKADLENETDSFRQLVAEYAKFANGSAPKTSDLTGFIQGRALTIAKDNSNDMFMELAIFSQGANAFLRLKMEPGEATDSENEWRLVA